MSAPVPEITVLLKVEKAPDLETHLCDVYFPEQDIRVLELRDYVPSLGEYGRGYWVSYDSVFALSQHLAEIHQQGGGTPT